MLKDLRPALVANLFFIVATGIAFPAVMTAASQAAFPKQANGRLVRQGDRILGSELIGQNFAGAQYFHPRPSAAGAGYDAANSSGTNLGPTSAKLIQGIHDPQNPSGDFQGVADLARQYRAENGLRETTVLPSDAVTRSGSGLDPHISVANAELQVERIAKARKIDAAEVRRMIRENTEAALGGFIGEPVVNVLKLNLALDEG